MTGCHVYRRKAELVNAQEGSRKKLKRMRGEISALSRLIKNQEVVIASRSAHFASQSSNADRLRDEVLKKQKQLYQAQNRLATLEERSHTGTMSVRSQTSSRTSLAVSLAHTISHRALIPGLPSSVAWLDEDLEHFWSLRFEGAAPCRTPNARCSPRARTAIYLTSKAEIHLYTTINRSHNLSFPLPPMAVSRDEYLSSSAPTY